MSEIELAQLTASRVEYPDRCFGVALTVYFTESTLRDIKSCLDLEETKSTSIRFNLAFRGCDESSNSIFTMCNGHWFDVCAILGIIGSTDVDKAKTYTEISSTLYQQICNAAQIDYKEMATFIQWIARGSDFDG